MQLKGIEAISDYLKREISTLFIWKSRFSFPMIKRHTKNTFIWEADTTDINGWLEERQIDDPKKVTDSELEAFKLKQLQKAGKIPKLNKKLNGINEIVDFCNLSIGTITDWFAYYDDCPIKKEKGVLVADADRLQTWLEKHNYKTGYQTRQGGA